MVNSCCAYGCKNRYKKCSERSAGEYFQFHRFPFKNPELLAKWVAACRRKNWKPTTYSVLCSTHFKKDDYQIRPGASVHYLKEDAIPSLFNFSTHLQNKEKKARRVLLRNTGEQAPLAAPSSESDCPTCGDTVVKTEICTNKSEMESFPCNSPCTPSRLHTEVIYTSGVNEKLIPSELWCDQLVDESAFPSIKTEIQDVLEDPLSDPFDVNTVVKREVEEEPSCAPADETVVKEELIVEEPQCYQLPYKSAFPSIKTEIQDVFEDPLSDLFDINTVVKREVEEDPSCAPADETVVIKGELSVEEPQCYQLPYKSAFPSIKTEIQDVLEDPLSDPFDVNTVVKREVEEEPSCAPADETVVIKEEIFVEEPQCNQLPYNKDRCLDPASDIIEGTDMVSLVERNQFGSKPSEGSKSSALSLSLVQSELSQKVAKHFECNVCKKVFKIKYFFKRHTKIHKKYQCDVCNKMFSRQVDINRHKIHNHVKYYHCDVCYKAFTNSAVFEKHKIRHSTSRRFHCTVCNKSYRYLTNLSHHKISHVIRTY